MTLSGPKILLHLEGLAVLVGCCVIYRALGASWSTFAMLFLAPDLSMAGYLFGKPIGARVYNGAHTYVVPGSLWLVAYFGNHPTMFPLCLIWIAHIGFDRLLGYGLKYDSNFKDTHLARV